MTQINQQRLSKIVGSSASRSFGPSVDVDPHATRKRRDPVIHAEGLPKWMVKAMTTAAVLGAGLMIVYGQPIYMCSKHKDAGQPYYGSTVGACVAKRATGNLEYAHGLVLELMAPR